MSFPFPDTITERIDLALLESGLPIEYVQAANLSRQKMCDSLLSQPSSRCLLDSIEDYLGYLQVIIAELMKVHDFDKKKIPKITWRSSLSKGIRMSLSSSIIQKPLVSCHSIWFEAVYVMLAYAFTLANMANRKIGPSPSAASEAACTEAADLLSRAAGVFRWVGSSWSTRWTDKKGSPPECNVELISLLCELMLADANRAALTKAEKLGLSSAALVKLGVSVVNSYENCTEILSRLKKKEEEELAEPFKSYVKDGFCLMEATLMKRFASMKHEEDQNGLAVACITRAYNQLIKCSRAEWLPYKKMALDLLPEVGEMRENFIQLNNNITYQRVPEWGEAKNSLPPGRPIAEIKAFVMPAVIDKPQPVDSSI